MSISILKSMLQDIINDRPEQAQAAMHEYFIAKSRELTETKESPGEQFSEGDKFYCDRDPSISNIKGCPDQVKDFIGDRSGLVSLKGAPSKVTRDFNVSANKITSMEGIPSFIGGDLIMGGNLLRSLKGIHNLVKHIGGHAYFQGNPIKSHVLGLLKIDGLKSVMLGEDIEKVQKIINKHLKGDRDVMACQKELIDAGFDEFAQL